MTRIRTGEALALAAILVSLPRHGVAQLHQAGMAVPSAPWWAAVVGVSAVAWTGLEAGTMFYLWSAYSRTRRRHLLVLMFAILAAIAATNAPSLVADSAGLTLTGLVGVASVGHWAWAIASIASTLIVVVAAGSADAATVEATDWRKRAEEAVSALTDAVDARLTAAQPAQTAPIMVQPVAAQQVTVNVSHETPAPKGRGRESATELAVASALSAGARSSSEIAAQLGISSAAVRQLKAWRLRPRVVQNTLPTHAQAQGGVEMPA